MHITINVFVMQAFMFLSGYFSKKPDRAQETAFSTFMWPYLVFTVLYYFIRIFFFGSANLKLLTPPFALWFLFVLFFYRFFLRCLEPLYGLCPENKLAFYFMVYGGALICGISFVSPFWIKLYDLLVDGPVKGSRLAKWLQGATAK